MIYCENKKVLMMPMLCALIMTGCTSLGVKENQNITKLQALSNVKSYVYNNELYNPDYSVVTGVVKDEKNSFYNVESYYQSYDSAGFLDKICIGKFKVNMVSGEVDGNINQPKEISNYRGQEQNKGLLLYEGM